MATTNLHHAIAALEAVGIKSRPTGRCEVFSDEFYLSHGKNPGGFGSWAFKPMAHISPADALAIREVVGKLNERPGLVGRATFDRGILFMPPSTGSPHDSRFEYCRRCEQMQPTIDDGTVCAVCRLVLP